MQKKWILSGLAAIAAASLVLGVVIHARQDDADGLPPLLQFTPPDSTFVLYANLAELRKTPLIERFAAMAPPMQTDNDYAKFVAATNFDFRRDLDRAVLAQHGNGTSSQTLAFAEGRFDTPKIQQYALQTGKLEHSGGKSIYVVPSASPGKHVTLEMLSNDRIALSDGPNSSPVSPTSAGAPSPEWKERLIRVAGSPLFMVARIPASGNTPNEIPGANNIAAFQNLRWINLAARPEGDNVLLSLEGECDTEAQAEQMAGGLQFLRSVLEGGLADPKSRGKMTADTAAAIARLLAAARISTETTRVRLIVTVTPVMLNNPPPAPSTPPSTPPSTQGSAPR